MLTVMSDGRKGGRLLRAGLLLSMLAAPLAACGGGTSSDAASGGEAASAGWEPEKDINWIVPYSPGGGFDAYSRGLADVMQQDHLPEGVNVGIQNVTPLPEGITRLYRAKPDGYTVGILPMPAAIAQQIQFPDVAAWETDKFTVLGSVDENAYVVYVADDSPYKTIDDLIAAKGLNTVTVERGSSSALAALSVIEELGLDAKITYGAEGSQEVVTAALRGDADFFVYGTTDVVGFIESGDVRPLLFLGNEQERPEQFEWLEDVPNAKDAGHPELAGVVTELRVIVAPPGLPAPVDEYLRTALAETMADEDFKAWAESSKRTLVPRDGEEAKVAMDKQIQAMQTLVPELVKKSGGNI